MDSKFGIYYTAERKREKKSTRNRLAFALTTSEKIYHTHIAIAADICLLSYIEAAGPFADWLGVQASRFAASNRLNKIEGVGPRIQIIAEASLRPTAVLAQMNCLRKVQTLCVMNRQLVWANLE